MTIICRLIKYFINRSTLPCYLFTQNAMVVDDEGGSGEGSGGGGGGGGGGPGGVAAGPRRMSGMAGLLDAGIIPEALPAPSHRVQAWDFTTGKTPEISDSEYCN